MRTTVAALLLVSCLAGQAIPFPGGKGHVGSASMAALPVSWEGKPALLLIGTHGEFLRYEYQYLTTVPTPVFRLAAAFFQDWRPCAVQPWSYNGGLSSGPSSQVHLNMGPDRNSYLYPDGFGYLKPDGSLLWMPGFGLGQRLAFDRETWLSGRPFHAGEYIRAQSTTWNTNCPLWGSNAVRGVQLMALVLVIEGFEW